MYDLIAVVVHCGSGPNRGHYITIVKSHGFWLLYDDDIVEVGTSGIRVWLLKRYYIFSAGDWASWNWKLFWFDWYTAASEKWSQWVWLHPLLPVQDQRTHSHWFPNLITRCTLLYHYTHVCQYNILYLPLLWALTQWWSNRSWESGVSIEWSQSVAIVQQ